MSWNRKTQKRRRPRDFYLELTFEGRVRRMPVRAQADLLAWLRDQLPSLPGMAGVSPSLTGLGEYPLYRQAEVSFSGGSDHVILSDPSIGVPTPMLIQWPDRFYHTSADTPDRTDPGSLARAGSLAAG